MSPRSYISGKLIETLFFGLFILTGLSAGPAYCQSSSVPRILFLHSYYQGSPWTDKFHESAVSSLQEEFGEIYYRAEYIDGKRHGDPDTIDLFSELLRRKYANTDFDVIIASDDIAYNLLLEREFSFAADVPIVFGGVNKPAARRGAGISASTGVLDEPSLMSTMQLALSLHPQARNMIIVADDITRTGELLLEETRRLVPQLPEDVSVNFELNLIYDGLAERLGGPGEESVIFWIGMIRDRDLQIPDVREQVEVLDAAVESPIYSCWAHSIGHGFVGGKLVDSEHQGKLASELAALVISGMPANEIPVVSGKQANVYMFDYEQLEAFNIDEDELPPESIIINKPSGIIPLPKPIVFTTVLAVIGLLGAVALLLAMIRYRKKSQSLLEESESKYRLLAENMRDILWTRDRDLNLTYISPSVESLLGYTQQEAMHIPLEQRLTPESAEAVRQYRTQLANAIEKGKPEEFGQRIELQALHKDGRPIWLEIEVRVVTDDEGRFMQLLGVTRDITERKQAAEALFDALGEKESMLLEIHHRVKNNLQIILGLLDITRIRTENEEALETIKEIHSKISSMALIHNELYSEKAFDRIGMSEFVQKLFYQLRSLYALPEVELQLSGEDFHLNMEKAIPLGLVLNELMTNSFKYAYGDGGSHLGVKMQKDKDTVHIEVSDDGPGLPRGFDPETTNRLGFKLIRSIVTMQLHGRYEVFSDNGTRVVLSFPLTQ